MKKFDLPGTKIPKIAILIKETACYPTTLEESYGSKLNEDCTAISLEYTPAGKAPVGMMKDCIEHILEAIKFEQIELLLVADAQYFKKIAGVSKAEPHYGYILPVKGHDTLKVALVPNYQSLFHNPKNQEKIDLGLSAVNDYFNNSYQELGQGIIHSIECVHTLEDTQRVLQELLKKPALACDVETFGLALSESRIGTIGFAWDQHNGIVIDICHQNWTDKSGKLIALAQFFKEYEGTLLFHNATFDIRCIIYDCFMMGGEDIEGMLEGLHTMYRRIHDTKLIVYLATNNTTGNKLSLKENAFEFAGNYAQDDIHDIRLIDNLQLMEYNLVDCLSTWYVYNKFYPKMVAEAQQPVYDDLFIPSLKVITQMELTGMPMDMAAINAAEAQMQAHYGQHKCRLVNSEIVKDLLWLRQKEEFAKANLLLKKKFRPLDEFVEEFNPGSPNQVSRLLYDHIGFDVIDYTDTGQPATGRKTIKKLYDSLLNQWNIDEEEV